MGVRKHLITLLFVASLMISAAVAVQSRAHYQETQYFQVKGEVKNPGKYESKKGLTLMQAIALAGGLTRWADKKRTVISRENQPNGQRKEIPVDLDAIFKGKKEDVKVLPNDMIVVPVDGRKFSWPPLLTLRFINVWDSAIQR